jgi:hypothetical protein
LSRPTARAACARKIRFLCRFALLIVDEIGYLLVTPAAAKAVKTANPAEPKEPSQRRA